MKKVRMIIEMTVTDEYYNKGIDELKKEIESGEHQRDMLDDFGFKKGLRTYTAEIIDVD